MGLIHYAFWKMNKNKSSDFMILDSLLWLAVPIFMYMWVLVGIIFFTFWHVTWYVEFTRENPITFFLLIVIWIFLVIFLLYQVFLHQKRTKRMDIIWEKYEKMSVQKRFLRYETFFIFGYILFFVFNVFVGMVYKE